MIVAFFVFDFSNSVFIVLNNDFFKSINTEIIEETPDSNLSV